MAPSFCTDSSDVEEEDVEVDVLEPVPSPFTEADAKQSSLTGSFSAMKEV